MSRKAEQNRISTQPDGLMVEHQAIYDDSLLPSADELAKINSINPEIVKWLLSRTEIEQNARLDYSHKRLELAREDLKKSSFSTNYGLTLAFVLLTVLFVLSFILVWYGYNLAGTIFGGIDVAAIFVAILKIKTHRPT